MARSPEQWAKDLVAGKSCSELKEIRQLVNNPWTGMGRYFATRGRIAQAEIRQVIDDATKRCSRSGLGRSHNRRRRK